MKLDKEKLVNMFNPVFAVVFSLLLGAFFMYLAGYDVGKAFGALFDASFGSKKAIANVLIKTTPLLLVGIAVAFAFRGSVFNIGGEGQFLAGALAGAAWAFIPGYLKAKYDVSEIITTIMFNYMAIRLIGFLVKGPLQEPGSTLPKTAIIAENTMLPFLIQGTKLHIGYLIGIILAFVFFFILFKTYWGYEVRAVGLNPIAAAYSGINVAKTTVSTMVISGAIAGLGGAIETAGVSYMLFEPYAPGYGYTGIAVSVLASNNPIGVIISSFLFGILNAGATAMQRTADVSAVFVNVFQGIIILAIAGSVTLKYVKKKKKVNVMDKGVEQN